MLKLCGFAASNYYNKTKLALLEKEIAFEEELVWGGSDPAFLAKSPLGKIPYIEDGPLVLSESEAIVEYLEEAYPLHPLIPRDLARAAKVRELVMFTEFYLEWEARRLYPEAFFGGKVSADVKEVAARHLARAVAALFHLARFEPFALGAEFTLADCVLATHLPVVAIASKIIYGTDVLGDARIKQYLAHVGERPAMRRVTADRKINAALLVERARSAASRSA